MSEANIGLKKLVSQSHLAPSEAYSLVQNIFSQFNQPQIAAFLSLLQAKGVTEDELEGLTLVMRDAMNPFHVQMPVVDIVGTGGDGLNTVNISTGGALLASACGVPVVKHGNRALTSSCGAADVLEACGVNLEVDPAHLSKRAGLFTFCYAPVFHPLLVRLKALRRDLGIQTCLHLVGPLLNPASASTRLVGVSNPEQMSLMAGVLNRLGVTRAMVFHCQGTDELCSLGPIQITELNAGALIYYELDPADYGIAHCSLADIQGRGRETNAYIIQKALAGSDHYPAVSHALILNAAMALYLYQNDKSLAHCIDTAEKQLRQGEGLAVLQNYVQVTQAEAL